MISWNVSQLSIFSELNNECPLGSNDIQLAKVTDDWDFSRIYLDSSPCPFGGRLNLIYGCYTVDGATDLVPIYSRYMHFRSQQLPIRCYRITSFFSPPLWNFVYVFFSRQKLNEMLRSFFILPISWMNIQLLCVLLWYWIECWLFGVSPLVWSALQLHYVRSLCWHRWGNRGTQSLNELFWISPWIRDMARAGSVDSDTSGLSTATLQMTFS